MNEEKKSNFYAIAMGVLVVAAVVVVAWMVFKK